jgi:predicted nucleotidyltransferase
MDIFDQHILHFWKCLNNQGVRYIMVGGVATNFHGYQRVTEDIDLWLEDTPDNRSRLRKAFKEDGLGDYEILETITFIPGWTDFTLNNGVRLDIMTGLKGLEGQTFEECYNYASIADIDGLKVPFLHINPLLQAKKAASRPKDRYDIDELEKIKNMLEEEGAFYGDAPVE